MTSELIERVARAIADTTDFDGDRIASRYADSELRDIAQSAITAVIEADREAVRAEQAAELAKYKALAETLAGVLDEWVFRYYWRHEGMNTEQARIYAKAQTEMMLRQYKEARDVAD